MIDGNRCKSLALLSPTSRCSLIDWVADRTAFLNSDSREDLSSQLCLRKSPEVDDWKAQKFISGANSPMKILCVHQGSELYGSDRSFVQSVRAIRKQFPEDFVSVLLPHPGPISKELAEHCNELAYLDVGAVSRHQLQKSPVKTVISLFFASVRSRKLMKEYDVVYLNTLVVFAFMLGAILLQRKVIQHVREVPRSLIEKIVYSIYFAVSRVRLIHNSAYTMSSYFIFNKHLNTVVLNGVNSIEMISENKISNKSVNLLVIGRLNAWKGQATAIEAVKILVNSGVNAKLKIVGSAPKGQEHYRTSLERQILELNLTHCVEMHDFIDEPKLFYNWSNIVLVPSIKPEPFGRVAIEAQSIGRIVIASNEGGIAEVLAGNCGGLLISPGSAEELSAAVIDLVNCPEKFEDKRKEALRNFQDRFTESAYNQNLIAAFFKYASQ